MQDHLIRSLPILFRYSYIKLILAISIIISINAINPTEIKHSDKSYALFIMEHCSDTLTLKDNNVGTYYHCGVGFYYDIKYELDNDQLTVEVWESEYQYKPSKKVPIANLKFNSIDSYYILRSIEYLHEHYEGEFNYLLSKVNTGRYELRE